MLAEAQYVTDTTKDEPVKRPQPEQKFSAAQAGHSSDFYVLPKMQFQPVIDAGGRLYHLKNLFAIRFEYLEDGTVFARHRELPVHAYGADAGDATRAFCRAFDAQYRHLVEADDAELTRSAQHAKRRMAAAVAKVDDKP